MRIYLIRHGRQSSRLCNVDVDLSPEGFRQAALLGERLFKTNIQAVYSSDLIRAVQTAQAANLYWNVEHTVLPELREISFGELTGLSDDAIRIRFADFKERESRMEEDIPYPGGECAGDVVRRAMPALLGKRGGPSGGGHPRRRDPGGDGPHSPYASGAVEKPGKRIGELRHHGAFLGRKTAEIYGRAVQ